VAIDNGGNAVVAWQSDFDPTDRDIYARRVSNSGVVGKVLKVELGAADDTLPVVALARTGGSFVVAHQSGTTVKIQKFNGANTYLGNLTIAGRSRPAISIGAGEIFQVITEGTGDGSGKGVFAQRGSV
jgi:hypothetical protein